MLLPSPQPTPMPAPTHKPDAGDQALPSGGLELAPGVIVREGDGVATFTFAKASGPGGQNVNKRSTKAELRVSLGRLPIPAEARDRLAHLARAYLTDAGDLLIVAAEHRSQGQNKDECVARLRRLLVEALVRPKTRRKTKPTRGSKERRLAAKKATGERKARRSTGGWDG
ncbi:MAG: alternative ribosome rescue aminoacyl-tRNA hydrolase ArfB [Phycisphaerales bacterium]